MAIWEQLEAPVEALGVVLHCVKVQETENNHVEYHGEEHEGSRRTSEPIQGEGYERIDQYDPASIEEISGHYGHILEAIGEDPKREGLQKTPERVAKALQYLTHGYDLDPAAILRSAMFTEEYSQMVLVKDIEVYSMCEHHMLPFFGKAHVAYIPNGRIVGLSKIPRVVDAFARRLQVQERLTNEIRDCIHDTLKPLGVAVVIEARHLCMQMRGIQKQNSVTTTSAFTGIFLRRSTAPVRNSSSSSAPHCIDPTVSACSPVPSTPWVDFIPTNHGTEQLPPQQTAPII